MDVDDWDVHGGRGGRENGRAIGGRLDVTGRDDGAATLGEGLDTDYGFGPILVEVSSHHGQGEALGIPRVIFIYINKI